MNIDFPIHFNKRGGTAEAYDEDHIRQMIEQLLFTSPGERVNRLEFGSGILQMIFASNSPELAAALQFTIQGAIQQYMADVIELQSLEVSSEDATLFVKLEYVIRRTGQLVNTQFLRQV